MIQFIDSLFLNLANKLTVFFSFFGVNRKNLAIAWIIVISCLFAFSEQFTFDNKFKLNVVSLVVWLGLILLGQLFVAIPIYLDESLKRYSFFFTTPYWRIVFCIIYPILAIVGMCVQIFNAHVFPWRSIGTLPSVFFYFYIFMAEDPNLNYRFGDIANILTRKIIRKLRQLVFVRPNPPA